MLEETRSENQKKRVYGGEGRSGRWTEEFYTFHRHRLIRDEPHPPPGPVNTSRWVLGSQHRKSDTGIPVSLLRLEDYGTRRRVENTCGPKPGR